MTRDDDCNRGKSSPVRFVVVTEAHAGQRVDNFLFRELKGVPKSHVYRLLRTGQVRINGGRARAENKLSTEDRLRIPPLRQAQVDEVPQASGKALQTLADAIVFEDKRFLVIDKPAGLAAHGGSGIALGAIEQLRQLRPAETLELVHRLDRDTSGVLVVARRRSALLAAQAALRDGRVRKRYLALLAAPLAERDVRVDASLRKSVLRGGERMVAVAEDGQAARSRFHEIERRGDCSYAEVFIDTGRTHQIRVHAAHIGAPVAGDAKYGDEGSNRALREGAGLRRMFLHATELAFDLADAGSYCFSAPLPRELSDVLDRLRC